MFFLLVSFTPLSSLRSPFTTVARSYLPSPQVNNWLEHNIAQHYIAKLHALPLKLLEGVLHPD